MVEDDLQATRRPLSYRRALIFAALLCLTESGLALIALFAASLPSLEIHHLFWIPVFIVFTTVLRLIFNTPLTALAFVYAARWIELRPRSGTLIVNVAVATVLLLVALDSPDEAPSMHFFVLGSCVVSPLLLGKWSPFSQRG